MPKASAFIVDDPWSGEIIAEVPTISVEEALARMDQASLVQRRFARTGIDERMIICDRVCDLLLADIDVVASELSRQLGKPLAQAREEVTLAVDCTRYYSSVALQALVDLELPADDGDLRQISNEPVGVVISVPVWSEPLLSTLKVAVPAVLAGNAVAIRASANAPLTARRIAELFVAAGAPDDLVLPLFIDDAALHSVVGHGAVGHVAFSGEEAAGRGLFAVAAATRLIDVSLEFGGNDAAYVAQDANVDDAAARIVEGAFTNAGQSLRSVDRVYVHRSRYEEFLQKAASHVKALRLGNPLDEATTLGPLSRSVEATTLTAQLDEAKKNGGRVIVDGGATQVNGNGRFFAPALVADAEDAWSLMRNGSTGPLLGVGVVEDDDEAIARINDSRFGQSVAVFTAAPLRAERLALKLEAGTVYLNRCAELDPALPWTSWKDSGRGTSLSHWVFATMTRRKSWRFRIG